MFRSNDVVYSQILKEALFFKLLKPFFVLVDFFLDIILFLLAPRHVCVDFFEGLGLCIC